MREQDHIDRHIWRYSARMNALFRALGLLLAGYIVVAVLNGAVYAKSGVWGRTFRRDEKPLHYWSAIAVYGLLSLALVFWF